MGVFELGGYVVESRKAATDDGSRSTAEADVVVGGEALRGTAVGGGPVDALEKALRAALLPAFPTLADVRLVDFTSSIVDGDVQVEVAAADVDGGARWPGVGRARDLLHASWLAVGDALERAVADAPVARPARTYPRVRDLAPVLRGGGAQEDEAVMHRLASTDWSKTVLDIASEEDRSFAARAVALGATMLYSFGNFCAIAAHPHIESVQRVNLQKGRPVNQVGSLTSTRERFASLFDWDLLPDGLTRAQVLDLFDDFFEQGPMGFRGPAAPSVSGQLTAMDAEIRTTQVVAPGYRCPSNALMDEILDLTGCDAVFATSANVSSGVTGRVEPAHYSLAEAQDDFGAEEGVVFIGHVGDGAENAVRASYPRHLPMSTSILNFHRLRDGCLVLERWGSLDAADVEDIVRRHGFGLVLADGARERLPMRA